MWQELRERIKPKGCELVTVALDATGGGRAARFLERAAPRHPSLIDTHHRSAGLFGFVNVPSSVWIDETGTIVRPAETAPRPPLRADAAPVHPSNLPERMRDIAEETSKINYDAEEYHEALADWVENGGTSTYALTAEQVIERTSAQDADAGLARAHFELATYFASIGEHGDAVLQFREAHRLAPDNWLYRRQAWSFEPAPNRFWQGPTPDDPDAWPYEGDWLTDIRRSGAKDYYPRFRP